MDAAIRKVKRLFPDAHCVKTTRLAGRRRFWILRDHEIPTEVIGEGQIPYDTWMHAKHLTAELLTNQR